MDPIQNPGTPQSTVSINKQFTTVTLFSKILAAILFIVLPFVGFWFGFRYARPQATPAITQNETTQVNTPTPSVSDTEGTATTTATGYIESIDANTVVVDYADLLYGEKALEAMIADGKCVKGDTEDECFHTIAIYDRNVNPTLRTFTLSPNVLILSDRGEKIATNRVSIDLHHIPCMLTINSKNEVVKIEGIFRP